MSATIANEKKKYEAYAGTIKKLFLFSGLWPGLGSHESVRLLAFLYAFIGIILLMANFNFIIHNFKNVALITKTMGMTISALAVILKVSLFTMHREQIKVTHEILESTFRREFANPEYRDVLLSPLVYFYRPTIIMARAFITIPSIYCVAPLLSIIIQRIRGADPIEYHTIFLTKYPWDPKASIPVYVVHYVIESIGAMGAGFVSASIDAGLGYYIFQIATQFRVLSYRLTSPKSSEDYRLLVRECVIRRRQLIDCCECIERVYGPIVLWFMTTSALSLCANVYQMSKMSSESIAAAIVYIVSKLLQALFYAWVGSFLTTETESFRDAIYSSEWPGSGQMSLMTSVLIMLMWKPVVLTACSFSTISMDMFVAILNTAVSYFFLLQTIEEKGK